MSAAGKDGEAVTPNPADVEKLRATIRFERGNPSDTDVAAVVAVLAAATGSAPQTGPEGPTSLWGDVRDRMRPLYFNGPNAFTSQTPLFWTKGT
ncbi:acyl-CoA carboxylase subunit epsilon [Tsukamurella asaccharolytica]|uniref:Acyl-CoA carboxylase subunit epsilon n=1 Tax=Tsukamurella asaccharolytica TaxID=2592067 RepID=A0A5C5R8J9_9ACTN|nr:acyl-CoA carboxylase subunit epsilon [Tsukamurella asaccharolytica]TWS19290.1 acyl-CoA carboxylase subunit epsilon [Tsukamurella asaccharolytica]